MSDAARAPPEPFKRDAAEVVSSPTSPSARKVALALGGRNSDDTKLLCAYAAKHVLLPDDHLTVLHVTESPTPAWVTQGEKRATEWPPDQLPSWVPDGLAAMLKNWPDANRVTAAELDSSSLAASDAIVDFCATHLKPDILLVGSRPRGMLKRAFVSSVSSYIVEYSNVPTLVVRGSALPPPPEPTAPLDFGSSTGGRRVAICLDGTVTGRRMVAWAAQVLLRAADDIYLLHSPAGLEAADLLPAMAEVEACRGMLLARGFPEQRANPVELDFHVDARDAIVDFLSGLEPFDLCICGSRGLQGRLTRLMLGSVGRYLLSYAPCPLLVLPAAVLKDPLAEAHEPGPA